MVNQVGDSGIKEQHQAKPGANDSIHSELNNTPHSQLLKHATSSKPTHADHLPSVCIVDQAKKPSMVADEDQNHDKVISKMAVKCPVNPEQPNKNAIDGPGDAHPTYPAPKKHAHESDRPASKSSLVADEDQNQDKLIARMILHPERK